MNRIDGIPALLGRVGTELGASGWIEIGQERIGTFADATGDHQWIHVDPGRAARESPFGTTIAHGYLTLSLLPMLSEQAFAVDGIGARLNYGLNRVRFPAPVPAGGRIRAVFRLKSVETQGEGRFLAATEATVELEGGGRPVCVAEMLVLYLV
ncbi:MaoC family dehydratase (plasmid) [Skermanella mucosa]|uniref:MaoC family dehydratase n=1 Tax=Skermanella mucosa TaxID=1789672 RepID=UPI00192CD902|nr:MaoC family dehydratase [Skermanella mucosa]UEM25212.1 MaoC family dehydratase [Skermanella mucosa]